MKNRLRTSSFVATMLSTAVAAATATSAVAGVLQWTANGPAGGVVRDFAIDPDTPSTLYATGFGVWKSTDAGASWQRLTGAVDQHPVWGLAIDPNDTDTLLAASMGVGVFRSTDAGASWTLSTTGLTSVYATSVAFDPVSPSVAYVGMRYGAVCRSTDGGQTWSAAGTGMPGTLSVTSLAVDPGNPQTIYAGSYSGMYKSTDGATSWTAVSGGLPPASVQSITIDPTDSRIVYAGMENRGVYKSADAGATWTDASNGLTQPYVNDVVVDPTNPMVLYVANEGAGAFKSTNGAATWVSVSSGIAAIGLNAIAVNPATPQVVYAGSYGSGAYKSVNGAASWSSINNGFLAARAEDLVVDAFQQGRVWAATLGGVWRSNDNAASWPSHHGSLPIQEMEKLAQSRFDPNLLYAATWRGLYKTTDGGVNWVRADNDATPRDYEAVATDPVDPNRVYAGDWDGLKVSDDAGASWRQPDTGPKGQRVLSFAFDPVSPSVIYSGAWSGIYRSDDAGETWTSSLDDQTIWSIAVDPATPSTLYVCTYDGVFKSTDGGTTWALASNGLTAQYCWAVLADPYQPSTLYMGSGAGVFVSTDAAATWQPFPGLESYNVKSLAFSDDHSTLFAATTDGGVAAYTFADARCTISCEASVPAIAETGVLVGFLGSADVHPDTCSGAFTYDWDFGDGTAHSSSPNPGHAYAADGSYTWTLTVSAGGTSCSRTGTIVVSSGLSRWYVPAVAHAPGNNGTVWRTDLAAVNRSGATALVVLTFQPYGGGAPSVRNVTLADGQAVEWRDALVRLFGIPAATAVKGSVLIDADRHLFVTARTYNQTQAGTYGQYIPALAALPPLAAAAPGTAQLAAAGEPVVIPGLKRGSTARTNFIVQNVGNAFAKISLQLFDGDGDQVGTTWTTTVPPGYYFQQDDIIGAAGGGDTEIAYALARETSGATVAWMAMSVIDNVSGDPTTYEPLSASDSGAILGGVAHVPGASGTNWRSDFVVVNLGADAVQFPVEFDVYNWGSTQTGITVSVAGRGTTEYANVVESLFGRNPVENVKGTIRLADQPQVFAAVRTYNQTAAGTYGQVLPAITSDEAFSTDTVGVIPQLKNNAAFRSNVGVYNVSTFAVTVRVTLYDANGGEAGTPQSFEVKPREYYQIDGIFAVAGAGTLDVAYATVEVLTGGGRVWAYGSVVDNHSGDPTTIPALTP